MDRREAELFHWWASIQVEAGGKQEAEGREREAGTLDVTAFTLATLFRTVPVDEWYNQRSRGTPVLDEWGRGRGGE